MHQLIEDKRQELNRLCRRFKVRRLDLFGSAAEGTFDPAKSDLDFLVEFLSLASGEHYESYFGLLEGLEALFRRPVGHAPGNPKPVFPQGGEPNTRGALCSLARSNSSPTLTRRPG